VIIAGAGGAAHLAGVIAAHTTLPVIGVPIPATALNGFDSLLATVQMPAGIPVATVAIGKAGATNAGILAAQILALSSASLGKKMQAHKEKLANSVEEKSKKLKMTLGT
jgi:phosphoribosylaminoimidazole carboxylase PurE protein